MSSPRISLQMINNMWDRLRDTVKCVLSQILICPHLLAHPQFLERTGEEQGASRVIRGICGCRARGSQLLRWEHKGPLIECYHATDTPDPSEPPSATTPTSQTLPHNHLREIKELHTHTSGAPHCSLCFAFTASSKPHKAPSPQSPPTATHHISGCLIHFCKGNERKASCAVGWGVLLSWRELSNAIKIHAGALHILLAEGSVGKQALPLALCCFH